MRNLRTLTMPNQLMDPIVMVDRFSRAGFTFDSIYCPIKFTKPWDRTENPDGTVTFRQWDADEC